MKETTGQSKPSQIEYPLESAIMFSNKNNISFC